MSKRRSGNVPTAFTLALSEINNDLSKKQKRGKKQYFLKQDLRDRFHFYKGCCSLCGYLLVNKGRRENSVHFILYVPLKNGGRAERDNLIPVCLRCKKGYHPKQRPRERVENYNSIPDLITYLVAAVKDGDERRVSVIKADLNSALAELSHCLHYAPNDELLAKGYKRIVNNQNTFADAIEKQAQGEDATEELRDVVEHVRATGKYTILRT